MRELADYNPEQFGAIIRWPLREALLCWVHRARRDALEEYRHQYLIFTLVAPYNKKARAPKLPAILKG